MQTGAARVRALMQRIGLRWLNAALAQAQQSPPSQSPIAIPIAFGDTPATPFLRPTHIGQGTGP
jgi:hypothetical protein